MAVREQVRVGGRSARIQVAVHDAVRALTAEVGREALTVPMIAGRAGVTPSTIYRRWGDLGELLADVAVERLRPAGAPADTGAVETDLEVWVEQYMEEMTSDVGRALLRDILGNAPETGQSLQCCSFTGEQLQAIADRASARGERAFRVEDALDQVIAPIIYRILFVGGPVSLDYCHGLLERFWRNP